MYITITVKKTTPWNKSIYCYIALKLFQKMVSRFTSVFCNSCRIIPRPISPPQKHTRKYLRRYENNNKSRGNQLRSSAVKLPKAHFMGTVLACVLSVTFYWIPILLTYGVRLASGFTTEDIKYGSFVTRRYEEVSKILIKCFWQGAHRILHLNSVITWYFISSCHWIK